MTNDQVLTAAAAHCIARSAKHNEAFRQFALNPMAVDAETYQLATEFGEAIVLIEKLAA